MDFLQDLFSEYKSALTQTPDIAPQLEKEIRTQAAAYIENLLQEIKDTVAVAAINEAPAAGTPAESPCDTANPIPGMLDEIYKFRTWTGDETKKRALRELIEQIRQIDPAEGDKAQQILDEGKKLVDLFNQAYKAGMKQDKSELARIKKEARESGACNEDIGRISMKFSQAKKKVKKLAQDRQHKEDIQDKINAVPGCGFDTSHPLFLGNQAPEKHWRIFIDETGSTFAKAALLPGTAKKDKGKFAALFVPENSPLPPLESHHATSENTEKNLDVLIDLIEKGKGCALLGVTLDGMASVDLDYYYTGLERLIDITLRLLKPCEEGSLLEFYVENRGDSEKINETQAMLQRTADACLYRYAKSFPESAGNFTLKMRCIPKKETDDKIFIAHNGYVDTVACAWNGGRKELTEVLKKNGIINHCLLEGDVQELPLVMDRLAKGGMISAASWNTLLASPDAAAADSPVKALLELLGSMLKEDIKSWTAFVDEVLLHLDSKAIDMRVLARQVDFLANCMPEAALFPIRLRAIWLTVHLAEQNHEGKVSQATAEKLCALMDKLYLEDAPLCCWSVLHMAVAETNAFRFEKARDIITGFANCYGLATSDLTFEKLFPDGVNIAPEFFSKAALPGIRYYGQLFSSLGQHEAFMGNFEKADDHFRKALNCYKLLSDKGTDDAGQTMSYLVINQMDLEKSPQKLIPLMEEYLGSDLETAARRFAVSQEPADKYRHAIMLRYFMELGKDHPAVKAYLELKENWKLQEGHPWEMIEFYRALLLENPEEKRKHLKNGCNMALDGGPALHLIACVIMGSVYCYDKSVAEKLKTLTAITLRELPDLDAKRSAFLRQQLDTPLPPLKLAKAVLPFNFR